MSEQCRLVGLDVALEKGGLVFVLLNGNLDGLFGFMKGGWAGFGVERRGFRRITPRWDHVEVAAGSASVIGAVCSV